MIQTLSNLSLSRKIVMMVGLLGTLTTFIIIYSMRHLIEVESAYHQLMTKQAHSSGLMNDALLNLSDSSRRVLSVLTEQEERQMRATQRELAKQAQHFRANVEQIRPLILSHEASLQRILQQHDAVFEISTRIIDSAARWRGDRALMIIHDDFQPALSQLRSDLDGLREQLVVDDRQAALQLREASQRTIRNTALAFTLALLASMGFAGYVSIAQISRPLNRLTRIMLRLASKNYQGEISGTHRNDELGQMARAMQVFRDTLRRAEVLEQEVAANAEIRRISQQLTDLADAIPGAVFQFRIHPDGTKSLLFTSSRLAQMLGPFAAPLHQRVERSLAFFPTATAYTPPAVLAFDASLQSLAPVDFDTQVDGVWLKTLATVQREPDGSTLFNCILLDISEMQRQAQALREARDLAEQAARARTSFLAAMSHEIRTPMNAVLGLIQATLRQPLPDDQRERIDKALHAGRHLLAIINDILDFSRSESGQMQSESIDFSPRRLLEETCGMLAEEAAAKGLRLLPQVASDIPELLRGDAQRIGQILINYLNNAIKFSLSGDIQLRLRLEQEGEDELFLHGEVEDQGIGISPDQLAGLFQPFQQADTSITRRFGGTGLGLSISRNLAHLMGGEVGAESRVELGSRFWFRVRVQAADGNGLAAPAQSAVIAPPAWLCGVRVLLVDDNELNRLVGRELLQSAGIEVDESNDGHQALERLHEAGSDHYDAVLMDMMMPVLDGLSATRQLRKNPVFDALPVIALSANIGEEDVNACHAAGMQAHIGKPIDERQLWSVLQQVLQTAPREASLPPSPAAREMPLAAGLLAQLKQSMPAERFQHLLERLLSDCHARQQRISQLAEGGSWEALQKEAHDLVGTAGHAGLTDLATLGQALSMAIKAQDRARVLDLAMQISITTRLASQQLLPWKMP